MSWFPFCCISVKNERKEVFMSEMTHKYSTETSFSDTNFWKRCVSNVYFPLNNPIVNEKKTNYDNDWQHSITKSNKFNLLLLPSGSA